MKLSFLNGGPVQAKAPAAIKGSSDKSADHPVDGKPADAAEPAGSPVVPDKSEETAKQPEKPAAVKGPVNPGEAASNSEKPARRTLAKSRTSLSITDIVSDNSDIRTEAVPDASPDDSMPDDETVKAKWPELAKEYSAKPRLFNALSNALLQFSEEEGKKVITFQVLNMSQKNWIEERLLRNLEDSLCKLLGSLKIKLLVSVAPDTEIKKKIYMPEDKAKDLMKHNDQVKNLVNDLDLDVK